MTAPRNDAPSVTFPNDLEVVITREFDAPLQLVFDVFTRPEHVRRTIAPFDETVTEVSIDLRVGGEYRYTFVTPEGVACSFRGTYLEIDAPHRTVETWHFEGWAGVEAIETLELTETATGTAVRISLAFADAAGRAHMTKYDGLEGNMDQLDKYLRELQNTATE